MTTSLPDFLELSDEKIAAETKRQDRLRRAFNTRTRLTGVEMEYARAMLTERDIKSSVNTGFDRPVPEMAILLDQLAEALAAQGRFIEAGQTAIDPARADFYAKAADAVYGKNGCGCENPLVAGPDGGQLRLPKYRAIKQIYSLQAGMFGYLVECITCGSWAFSPSDPSGPAVSAEEYMAGTAVDDTIRLRA